MNPHDYAKRKAELQALLDRENEPPKPQFDPRALQVVLALNACFWIVMGALFVWWLA